MDLTPSPLPPVEGPGSIVPAFLERVSLEFLQKHLLLPMEVGGRLRIGFASRSSLSALEDIRLLLQQDVEAEPMAREDVEEGLRNLQVERLDHGAGVGDDEESLVLDEDESTDLYTVSTQAPIVQLVNSTFIKARKVEASDIHLEPYADQAVVRIRVDGVLQDAFTVPRARYPQVVQRIKVMAKLNLAESRLPQDGRIKLRAGESQLDIRVSIVPTLFGERVVLRLLDRSLRRLTLQDVGLEREIFDEVKAFGEFPHGLILSTGPTGSGKSTTLYALLLAVQSAHRNIITIEDPVEYQVARIGQIQVNAKIGLTFAEGLRSILRQDPDIVMVGEIRDAETAEIAIHAALTGHLVLSTLHTNDAPSAVSRLIDMGAPGFLISASLLGIVAQRLVRRLCPKCRVPYALTQRELTELRSQGIDTAGATPYAPGGCPECINTGYKGRTGIFEVLKVDEEIAQLIARSGEAGTIRTAARGKGMRSLFQDGARKFLAGVTSMEEILRATRAV